MFYVYLLIDPQNNKIFYVGKGKGARLYRHVATIKSGKHLLNKHLENKIKKILKNHNNIRYKIVFETRNEQEAFNFEVKTIKLIGINNLCNLTNGGEGCSATIATRKKLSKSIKKAYKEGRLIAYFKDKKMSDSMKEKMSKSHIGKKFTEEHIKNISKSLTNRKLSQTHIDNLKKTRCYNTSGSYTKNLNFLSYNDAKEWLLINYPTIKSKNAYLLFTKNSNFPIFLAKSPYITYKLRNEWISWIDYLNKT